MKRLIIKLLERRGYVLRRADQGFWMSNQAFLEVYARCIRNLLKDKGHKTYLLYQFARYACTLPEGAVAEVGVFRGDTAQLLAEVIPDRPLHLFDTFEGLPGEVSPLRPEETFTDTSLAAVEARFAPYGKRVALHPGVFPASTRDVTGTFALVHIDVDLWETATEALRFFYPLMVPGGVLVIDDYRSRYWPKVGPAVDAFAESVGNYALHVAKGKAVIIKK